MKDEIAAAVFFVTKLVRRNPALKKDQVEKFQNNLTATLLERFKDHWYENTPSKGQGYRCIRMNETERIDPVLDQVAISSGLMYGDLGLPNEMTLWIDPQEVSCRLGETFGSFCTVGLFQGGSSENKAQKLDLEHILATHFEKKQVQHRKFVQATSTRTKRRDSASRSSPPVTYHQGPNRVSPPVTSTAYTQGNSRVSPPVTGYPPNGYTNMMGWEDQSNGYHNGYQSNPNHHNNSNWGNWGNQSDACQLSPNGNSMMGNPDFYHSKNSNGNSSGGMSVMKPAPLSSQRRYRWVKPEESAQA